MRERAVFSGRTSWDLAANALAGRLEAALAAGALVADLTESNPTRAGLRWPEERLAAALGGPGLADYVPDPRGALAARRAVAAYLRARGAEVDPDRILLTASTSEGYGFLLKLLCDPGDEVLVPAPAYPLLDLLAGLEGVAVRRYPLRWSAQGAADGAAAPALRPDPDGEWRVDLAALADAIGPRTRAVLVVSPSNPTGAVLSPEDLRAVDALCAARGAALVSDEVFADSAPAGAASALGAAAGLTFHLSGLSKVCGLPQLKVGWIAMAGPEPLVRPALERLEIVADTWLSVSAPSQRALVELLPEREAFLGPLRARLAANRAALDARAGRAFTVLRGAGGWSAVLRIGEVIDEEELCLALLDDGVAVQPGFFFDFERSGYLVVSLLASPDTFTQGVERIVRRLEAPRPADSENPQ